MGILSGRNIIFAIGFFFCVITSAVSAQGNQPEITDKWSMELTPYFFASALKGTAGVNGVAANVDMSFGNILDNLDGALMGIVEARKGRWGFSAEGIYFKLADVRAKSWAGPLGNTNTGTLDVESSEKLYQFSTLYRVLDATAKVDVIGAARYTKIESAASLTVTTGAPLLPDGTRKVSQSESWWDPVIGTRVHFPVADRMTLVGLADVGGFGIGSDLSYQLYGGINWQFSRDFVLKAGYRYFYQDYAKNGFLWDMKTTGLVMGLGIQF